MNTAWVHAKARVAAIAGDGRGLLLYGIALVSSSVYGELVAADGVPMRAASWVVGGDGSRSLVLPFQLLNIAFWSAVVALASAGRSAFSGGRGLGRAMPALPVGRSTRVLVEAALALGVVLAARTGLVLAAALLRGAATGRGILPAEVVGYIRASTIGAAIAGPSLMLWMTRGLVGARLRHLAVLATLGAATLLGWMSTLAGCVVVCGALGAAVLWLDRLRAPAARTSVPARGDVTWSARTHRPPHVRMALDLAIPPLGTALLLASLLVAGVALDPWVHRSVRFVGQSLRYWMFFFFGVTYLTQVLTMPGGRRHLGAPVLTFSGPSRLRGLWSTLPVRPEWLTRALYLHVLLGGLLMLGILIGADLLLVAFDRGAWPAEGLAAMHPKLRYMLLELAVIPSLASAVVAGTVGARGHLGLAALVAFGVFIGVLSSASPGVGAALGWVVLVMGTVVGGIVGLSLLTSDGVRRALALAAGANR